jgi:CRISPR system Cascade subunit CasD
VTTLVCRLSGPLQSWGEHAKFTRRGSLPYPTYAALLGLARAALGYGRDGNDARTGAPADDRWLRTLTMAARIDQPGRTLLDYHTVNPSPVDRYHWLSPVDRGRLATVPMGNGRPWVIGVQRGAKKVAEQQTLQTWRTYLTDAAFTWLVEGEHGDIVRLAAALTEPYWQLSLGRKACLPDHPLVLGTTGLPLLACAEQVPVTGPGARRPLHLLTAPPGEDPPITDGQPLTHADVPLGPHPHDGYGYLTRTVTHVTPPRLDRAGLLDWAKENLTS